MNPELYEEGMTEEEKKALYHELERINGQQYQRLLCLEEMAELTKEVIKHERGKGDLSKIAEEIADAEITLEQIKMSYDLERAVDIWKEEKLKRTAEKLEKKKAMKGFV